MNALPHDCGCLLWSHACSLPCPTSPPIDSSCCVQLFVQRPPWDAEHTLWKAYTTAVQYTLQSERSPLTKAGNTISIQIFQQNFSRGGFMTAAFAQMSSGQRLVAKRVMRERRKLQDNIKELEVRPMRSSTPQR